MSLLRLSLSNIKIIDFNHLCVTNNMKGANTIHSTVYIYKKETLSGIIITIKKLILVSYYKDIQSKGLFSFWDGTEINGS